MRISDRSRTDFDRAKIKLTGHFDHGPIGRYFEPCIQPCLTKCTSEDKISQIYLLCLQLSFTFLTSPGYKSKSKKVGPKYYFLS